MRRYVAPALHTDSLVPSSVDHERWYPDGRKNAADLDLAVHAHERGYGGRAGAQPLVAAPPALERRVICARGRESLHAAAGAPRLFDIAEECRECFLSREPVRKARQAAVDHQRAATVRVGCSKQNRKRSAFGN